MSKRSVLVVAHTGRPEAVRSAQLVIERLSAAGICVRVLDREAEDIGCAGVDVMPSTAAAAEGAEDKAAETGNRAKGAAQGAAEVAKDAKDDAKDGGPTA